MEENKQNSSDLADLPELELDDLEFQEEGEGLDALQSETESNLDDAFGDLDFSVEGESGGQGDPFSDIDDDAIATGDYELPESESAESADQMNWDDSGFEEETFDSSAEFSDDSASAEERK